MTDRELEYKQLTIELSARGGGRLKILGSPMGKYPETTFTSPFNVAQVKEKLQGFDELLKKVRKDDPEAKKQLLAEQEEMGKLLFGSLFIKEIREVFLETRGVVEALRAAGWADGLRIRLVCDPAQKEMAHVAALPWELMFDDGCGGRLGCSERTPILRFLKNSHINVYREIQGKLRVLVVAPQPSDLHQTYFEGEVSELQSTLEEVEGVEVQVMVNPTLEGLQSRLEEFPCHVLHFYGHGGFKKSNIGHLCFVKAGGEVDRVSGAMLAEYLKESRDLRLVVLNACKGGNLAREACQHPFAGVAAAMVEKGVPAVVAMQFSISIKAAKLFSKVFYRHLIQGFPVDAAATRARKGVLALEGENPEWATPAVFTSIGDGRALRWEKKLRQDEDGHAIWRIGIRSFGPGKLVFDAGIEKCDELLDLSEYFEERKIRHPALWQREVMPKLKDFLDDQYRRCHQAGARMTLEVDFVAHASVAFAAGYFLDGKSGLKIRVSQRVASLGQMEFFSHDGKLPTEPLWKEPAVPEGEVGTGSPASPPTDTALAISVTNHVLADVEVYMAEGPLVDARLRTATIAPSPGVHSVLGGTHALALAVDLAEQLGRRPIGEKRGTLHCFASAPNAFLFYLGQQAKPFNKVQFYEYAHGSAQVGGYEPSIRLPLKTENL